MATHPAANDAGDRQPRVASRAALRRRALVLVGVVVVLVLVATSDALFGLLTLAAERAAPIIATRPVLGAALFVLLAALSAMLAFFSSSVLVPVVLQVWSAPVCAALLWLGWTLGGMAAYGLSRHLGRPVVRRISSASALEHYEQLFSQRVPFGLVLLFQLALPSEVPGYVLGLVRYPFAKYLLALTLAELPFAVGAVYVGASLLERQPLALVLLLAAGGALSLGALYALRRRLRRSPVA